MSYFHSILQWPAKHTLTVSLILFVIGCVVSVYSKEINAFLRHWPMSTLRQRNREWAETRIRVLKGLHNNVYQLNLHFYYAIVDTIVYAFRMSIFLILPLSLLNHTYQSFSILSAFSGCALGTAIRLREIFNQLYDYDNAIQKLEAQIQRNSEKAAATQAATN